MSSREAEQELLRRYRALALGIYDYVDCVASEIEQGFRDLDAQAQMLGIAVEPLPTDKLYRKLAEECNG
jgi:hypothetical protein